MAPDELLVKYLAGEAGADERAQAELWMAASKANGKYFEHFKLIWEESQKLVGGSAIDEDKAWNRFRERIQKEYIATAKPKFNLQWLKVAAVILLVSGVALLGPYFFRRNGVTRNTSSAISNPSVTLVTSTTTDHIRVDTLPDGSVITLNRYSNLKYPADFRGHTRNIQLSGEAFFNVRHDPNKPFVIKVNDILVTVLGTSFNVKNRGDTTAVIVETGLVSIRRHEEVITLHAGEKLTALKTDSALTKEQNTDKLYRNYFDKKLIVQSKRDTPFDINKHPALLKKILQSLKYTPQNPPIAERRAVIRKVMDEIMTQRLVGNDSIKSFRLNDTVLLINDKRQPEAVHRRFKDRFIKESGYTIYFGGSLKDGKGIYMMPDSL